MGFLPQILKVLDSTISKICAVAVGLSTFLLFPESESLRSPVLLIVSVLWCYLIIRGALFLYQNYKRRCEQSATQKKALQHLESKDFSIYEAMLLVDQKRKKEQLMVQSPYNQFIASLCGKGLLQQGRKIAVDKWEFFIPDFVWKSEKLQAINENIEEALLEEFKEKLREGSRV